MFRSSMSDQNRSTPHERPDLNGDVPADRDLVPSDIGIIDPQLNMCNIEALRDIIDESAIETTDIRIKAGVRISDS